VSREYDKKRFIHLLVNAALWLVLCVLLVLSVLNVNSMRKYSSISLRYETPISGETAYQSRVFAISRGDATAFWPTFWHEKEIDVQSEYRKAYTKCIIYSGDATLVWPALYLTGTAPGVTDGNGCAVSSGFAWSLWGSADVIGKIIETDGAFYTIRGVFTGDDLLIMLSVDDEDKSHSFTAVELTVGAISPSRSDVESYAVESGLGAPDSILMGRPVLLAVFLAALPVLILSVFCLGMCFRWLGFYPAALRGFVWVAALFVLAGLLPVLIKLLPEWMLPTRWSDFSFWGSLLKQLGTDLNEYFTLSPKSRDVIHNTLFFKQIGIAFLSTCLAISICFRFKQGDGSSAR